MWEFVKREAIYLHGTFHDSETILWARLQVAIGSAWLALSTADLTPIIVNPKWIAYWTIFNGFVSEMLRRSRAEFDGSDDHGSK
jgi:hypothetical protein